LIMRDNETSYTSNSNVYEESKMKETSSNLRTTVISLVIGAVIGAAPTYLYYSSVNGGYIQAIRDACRYQAETNPGGYDAWRSARRWDVICSDINP